jgi:hypothetical protein
MSFRVWLKGVYRYLSGFESIRLKIIEILRLKVVALVLQPNTFILLQVYFGKTCMKAMTLTYNHGGGDYE